MKTTTNSQEKTNNISNHYHLYIYNAIPKLFKQDQYEKVIEKFNNNKAIIDGLQLRVNKAKNDENLSDEYINYINSYLQFDKMHITELDFFKKQIAAKNLLNHKIVNEYSPICSNKEDIKIFNNTKRNDIIFVNSHGNSRMIGIGRFMLYPQDLAQNFEVLGLPKNSCPTIVVWSCNSSQNDKELGTNFATSLYNEMKKLGYKSPNVIGFNAKIKVSLKYNKVSFLQDDKEVSSSLATHVNMTPKRKVKQIGQGGLFTNLNNIAREEKNNKKRKLTTRNKEQKAKRKLFYN